MSLANVSLKLWSLNMAYTLIFLLKKYDFFSKNTCELDIALTRTVNILTLNELVKLTTLWTTGPRQTSYINNRCTKQNCNSGTALERSVRKLLDGIRKTCLFKYIENFTTKNGKISDKNSDIFHISAQNIDCGYSLEPPRRGGSNDSTHNLYFIIKIRKIMYTPVNPSFTI